MVAADLSECRGLGIVQSTAVDADLCAKGTRARDDSGHSSVVVALIMSMPGNPGGRTQWLT